MELHLGGFPVHPPAPNLPFQSLLGLPVPTWAPVPPPPIQNLSLASPPPKVRIAADSVAPWNVLFGFFLSGVDGLRFRRDVVSEWPYSFFPPPPTPGFWVFFFPCVVPDPPFFFPPRSHSVDFFSQFVGNLFRLTRDIQLSSHLFLVSESVDYLLPRPLQF